MTLPVAAAAACRHRSSGLLADYTRMYIQPTYTTTSKPHIGTIGVSYSAHVLLT